MLARVPQRRRDGVDRELDAFADAGVGFAGAVELQPEWLNPKWVSALYSPRVVKTIAALNAERVQRYHLPRVANR